MREAKFIIFVCRRTPLVNCHTLAASAHETESAGAAAISGFGFFRCLISPAAAPKLQVDAASNLLAPPSTLDHHHFSQFVNRIQNEKNYLNRGIFLIKEMRFLSFLTRIETNSPEKFPTWSACNWKNLLHKLQYWVLMTDDFELSTPLRFVAFRGSAKAENDLWGRVDGVLKMPNEPHLIKCQYWNRSIQNASELINCHPQYKRWFFYWELLTADIQSWRNA